MNTLSKTLLFTTALTIASSISAFADTSDDRIKSLELKLAESIQAIQMLSKEMTKLKKERRSVSGTSETEERIVELEDAVDRIDEKVGSRSVVSAFDAVKLDIGGFLHTSMTHVNGEDGDATSFNRQIFELLVKADLGDDWSAFIAQAFLRQSSPVFSDGESRRTPGFNISNGALATNTPIAWANYKHSDELEVRIGRQITPHGIVNIEHFPAILLDAEQPQFLRPFSGNTIFPNFITGIHLHGKKYLDDNKLQYSVYSGNFAGNSENLVTGGRLAYTFGDSGLTFGVNGSFGERDKTADSNYSLYGADILIDKGPILWKTEVYQTDEDLNDNRFAFYTQPAYRLNDKWIAYYRYDYLDDGGSTGETIENVLGLTFKPTKNVHLRVNATNKQFESGTSTTEADAQIYQASATFNF